MNDSRAHGDQQGGGGVAVKVGTPAAAGAREWVGPGWGGMQTQQILYSNVIWDVCVLYYSQNQ